ncbi:MAG: GNAT family N-acetyltransferase [Clostridia bacterium]
METHVRSLTSSDYGECLQLMNEVFGEGDSQPMQMERDLPKEFESEQQFTAPHWGVVCGGQLRAVVGCYPMTLCIGSTHIACATVGNVVTHADFRNQGMMQTLMGYAMRALADQGILLSRLNGLRLRYNRYGYERAGTVSRCTLTAANVQQRVAPRCYAPFSFRKMELEDAQTAQALYQTRAAYILRGTPDVFLRVLHSHFMQPWVVLDAAKQIVGYLTASANGAQINECVMRTEAERLYAISAWMEQGALAQTQSPLYPWETEALQAFGDVCETIQDSSPSMFKVLGWAQVADAFMKLKQRYSAMVEGEIVIKIEDFGKLCFAVHGEEAACTPSRRTADVSLSHRDATRLIFGPTPPSTVRALPRNAQQLLGAWFPLPLSWFPQDNV